MTANREGRETVSDGAEGSEQAPGGPLASRLFGMPEPPGWQERVEAELEELEEAERGGAELLRQGLFIRS